MDERRFEAALRALGAATGRRQTIGVVLGALFGGGVLDAVAIGAGKHEGKSTGATRKQPGTESRSGSDSRKTNVCARNSDCRSGICERRKGKKNKNGHGRCRCVKQSKTCKSSRNCCNGMSCVDRRCVMAGPSGCTSNTDCSGATDTCTSGTCTCGGAEACAGAAAICAGGSCVACVSNGDCPAGQPICSGNSCVACVTNSGCSGATDTCTSGTCTCGGKAACSGATDTCTNGTCTCGGKAACSGAADTCTNGICACGLNPACSGTAPVCCAGSCAVGTWVNQIMFGSGPASGPSELNDPYGVALSADGLSALVADSSNSRISVWTRTTATGTDWKPQKTFGTAWAGRNQFNSPLGVALSVDGLTAVVSDSGNNRMSVWTRTTATGTDWQPQTTFGSSGNGSGQFWTPWGVALSSDGLTVVVVDAGNARVSVWTRTRATGTGWQPQTTFGSSGYFAGEFLSPKGLALSVDGLTVAVANTFNNQVPVWTRTTATGTDWQLQTTNSFLGVFFPSGVALSVDGLTAVVAEAGEYQVSVWTRTTATGTDWQSQATFGSGPGNNLGQFQQPSDVALSVDGLTAVIADAIGQRVSVWARSCPA